MIKLPQRYKEYGIGKYIGGNIYLHRDYEYLFPDGIIKQAIEMCSGFKPTYNIVKYNPDKNKLSLLTSPDFDTTPEPQVDACWVFDLNNNTYKLLPYSIKYDFDPYIYHHKWLMVKDDYKGFDVEESKRRSEQWMALSDIDYTRIGKKKFWKENVLPRLENEDVV